MLSLQPSFIHEIDKVLHTYSRKISPLEVCGSQPVSTLSSLLSLLSSVFLSYLHKHTISWYNIRVTSKKLIVMSPVTLDPAAYQGIDTQELAKQLYDVLMAEIEPDLLLENIPGLDAKYAGEGTEEKKQRLQRYEAAYKRFDAEFNAFMADVNAEVRTSKRESLAAKESQSQSSDQQAISSLESAFS
jgi:hypothetical protein